MSLSVVDVCMCCWFQPDWKRILNPGPSHRRPHKQQSAHPAHLAIGRYRGTLQGKIARGNGERCIIWTKCICGYISAGLKKVHISSLTVGDPESEIAILFQCLFPYGPDIRKVAPTNSFYVH